MNSRDFVYWFQGYLEIASVGDTDKGLILSPAQVQCIRNHLGMVFKHEIDPSYGDKQHQQDLQALHSGGQAAPTGPKSPSTSLQAAIIPGISSSGVELNC